MKKVLVIDTSILCIWLKVPFMDTAGPDHDKWDKPKVDEKILSESKIGTTFVLPLATIIETGNHIAHANGDRKSIADSLADLMMKAADNSSPWAAFSSQTGLWTPDKLKELASTWPSKAVRKISIGDATIIEVAELYASMGYQVEILTGDQGLKSYESSVVLVAPRRRKPNQP